MRSAARQREGCADVDPALAQVADRVDDGREAAAQSVQGGDHDRVARTDVVQEGAVPGAVIASTGHLVGEDSGHAQGLQCIALCVMGLVIRRHADVISAY